MKEYFDSPAPHGAHHRLDRMWLCREPEGAVSCSTLIFNPEDRSEEYLLELTLTRVRT